jgi:hypothetical protein
MVDPSLYKVFYQSGNQSSSKLIQLDNVTNLSIQNSISTAPEFVLGGANFATEISSPTQTEISFSRSFTKRDFIIEYTGSNPILNLYIFNGEKYFRASNLYLQNYSAKFSIGELPVISTNFVSYGEGIFGYEEFPELEIVYSDSELDIPKLNSIKISGLNENNSFKNNLNIYEFNYNLAINRQPYYSVGDEKPIEVSPILPINISVSINSRLPNSFDSIKLPRYDSFEDKKNDFDIIISGRISNFTLPIRNSKLVDSQIQYAGKNAIEINSNYIGSYGL